MASEAIDHSGGVRASKVAGRFIAFGKIGFWGQLFLLIIGSALAAYTVIISGQIQSERYLDLGNLISLGFFLIPVFTTLWCLRYGRLGRRLQEQGDLPPVAAMRRTAWVGVYAGVIGAVLSLLFLFGAVLNLLYVLLSTPQVGLLVAPAAGAEGGLSVSAIDAVSLLSLLVTLATELLMVWLSLWLVFTARGKVYADA